MTWSVAALVGGVAANCGYALHCLTAYQREAGECHAEYLLLYAATLHLFLIVHELTKKKAD